MLFFFLLSIQRNKQKKKSAGFLQDLTRVSNKNKLGKHRSLFRKLQLLVMKRHLMVHFFNWSGFTIILRFLDFFFFFLLFYFAASWRIWRKQQATKSVVAIKCDFSLAGWIQHFVILLFVFFFFKKKQSNDSMKTNQVELNY